VAVEDFQKRRPPYRRAPLLASVVDALVVTTEVFFDFAAGRSKLDSPAVGDLGDWATPGPLRRDTSFGPAELDSGVSAYAVQQGALSQLARPDRQARPRVRALRVTFWPVGITLVRRPRRRPARDCGGVFAWPIWRR
jgi:hypothetical protein